MLRSSQGSATCWAQLPMFDSRLANQKVRSGAEQQVSDWRMAVVDWRAFATIARAISAAPHDFMAICDGDEQRRLAPKLDFCRWCGQTKLDERRQRATAETDVDDVTAVSALLLRPAAARACYVFAHGAGAA